MKNGLHFIMTGGTIDSYYEGTKDTVVPSKHSIIPRYIGSLRLTAKFSFTEVCMKDSRSLTKTDLVHLLKTVEKSPSQKLLITHGTYTMGDTARFLKANLKRKDQIIILTGSFIPLDGFNFSDGPFNIGFAVAQFQQLQPGVYISMNGKVLTAEEVMKIISRGTFDSIFGDRTK